MPTITQRVNRNAKRRGVRVIGRKGWLNTSRVYQTRRKTRPHMPPPSDTVWQHITVTRRTKIRPDMRLLHKIGMERFQSGVSYNVAIDMVTGELGVGQALDASGTHTVMNKKVEGYTYNQNRVAFGIAFIGMPGDKLSSKAIHSAAKYIAALIDEGALNEGFDYNPHSMAAFKDCPTDAVRAEMPRIHKLALDYAKVSYQKGKNPVR